MRRYREYYTIISDLDPMSDVLVLIEYLSSNDYLVDLLMKRNHLSKREAKTRARRIKPHVKTAIDYIRMSLAGPTEIAFLPAYYAILNLIKVYILFGPHHKALPRYHGASYPGYEKDSHNLLTEQICLRQKGAIPLFYRTVTGDPIPVRKKDGRMIAMADVYPFVSDISAEFHIATGQQPLLALIDISASPELRRGKRIPIAKVRTLDPSISMSKRDLKVFLDFRKDGSSVNQFRGRPVTQSAGQPISNLDQYPELRKQLRTCLIYYPHPASPKSICTPICSKSLLLPEELPIVLLFFHMSSVVRYKPEFLAKLRDSRFWPVLAAAHRHSLLKLMTLFWSYIHHSTLIIQHGSSLPVWDGDWIGKRSRA